MELDIEFRYPNKIDFFGTTLCHLCQFSTYDLQDYATYDRFAEDSIEQGNIRIREKIDRLLAGSDKDTHEDIINSFSQDFQELADIYPSIHRKSMVIALYNFFEHQIKTLCIEVNKLLPVDMSDKYLRTVCIKSYRKFLRCEAGFDLNPGGLLWGLWEDMLKVEQIRHVLVHSEGEIEEHRVQRHADIDSYSKKRDNISLNRHIILIENGFVAALITDLITLFDQLDNHVHAFIKRYETEHGRYEDPLPAEASRTSL